MPTAGGLAHATAPINRYSGRTKPHEAAEVAVDSEAGGCRTKTVCAHIASGEDGLKCGLVGWPEPKIRGHADAKPGEATLFRAAREPGRSGHGADVGGQFFTKMQPSGPLDVGWSGITDAVAFVEEKRANVSQHNSLQTRSVYFLRWTWVDDLSLT